MPPTRGHDLKHYLYLYYNTTLRDAPHTGARLETWAEEPDSEQLDDAPHTGARLETVEDIVFSLKEGMPPTRGHDLKLFHRLRARERGGCPPHGGTT